jgi:hypothetical protein
MVPMEPPDKLVQPEQLDRPEQRELLDRPEQRELLDQADRLEQLDLLVLAVLKVFLEPMGRQVRQDLRGQPARKEFQEAQRQD